MSKFGVHVATWNVGKTQPPADLSTLVGLPESEYVIDVLAIGLQEVPWNFWTSPDPANRENPWLRSLTNILGKSEFVLLTANQMCGSFLAIFVQRGVLPFVSMVETAHTATGLFGLFGTKGVVSVRFQLHGTWFSFVNSHLAAHSWNSMTRIWEYDTILEYHTYADKSKILDHDYVFWFGDLNFRLERITREKIDSAVKSKAYSELFEHDQLTCFQREGLIFSDFEENGLYFPPTYKKTVGKPDSYVVQPYRLPSWCDRILYSSAARPFSIHVLDYADLPMLSTSDHTPVFLQANVSIPNPASNSLVRFGPVTCETSLSNSPNESGIIMSCTFSFANGFKATPKDTIAMYRKFFARLDDDAVRWPASDFLPLRVIRLDINAEVEQPLPPGFYCIVYHHFVGPLNQYRVAGISDYFAVGDVSSDEDDFGDDTELVEPGDSGDSADGPLNESGDFEADEDFDEREHTRSGSAVKYRSAAFHNRLPPRPKSARGHYDDLSLTPGAASGSSDASFAVTPTMLTPSLPTVEAWPPSPDDVNTDLADSITPAGTDDANITDVIEDEDDVDDVEIELEEVGDDDELLGVENGKDQSEGLER